MKRRYIVGDILEFYPDERVIKSKITEKSVMLHTPGALCLEEILKNRGNIVTQNHLFRIGWGEKLSQQTSQACYYQCFVNLRKQLSELRITDQVVITVPRRGMRFNEALKLTYEAEEKVVNKKEAPIQVEVKKEKNKKIITIAYVLLFLFVSVIYLYLLVNTKETPLSTLFGGYSPVAEGGDCFLIHNYASGTDKVIKFMERKGYYCNSGKKYYIYNKNDLSRVSFFMCDEADRRYCTSVTLIGEVK